MTSFFFIKIVNRLGKTNEKYSIFVEENCRICFDYIVNRLGKDVFANIL